MDTNTKLSFVIKLLIGLCILVVLILLSLFIYNTNQKKDQTSVAGQNRSETKASIDGKPTPNPLPKGKQSFTISGAKKNGLEWKIATLDPYDPSLNQKQSISVKAVSDTPIKEMIVTLESDSKKTPYPLTLSDGTEKDGTWQSFWTVEDTHEFNYSAILKAENGSGGDTLTLTFR